MTLKEKIINLYDLADVLEEEGYNVVSKSLRKLINDILKDINNINDIINIDIKPKEEIVKEKIEEEYIDDKYTKINLAELNFLKELLDLLEKISKGE